MATVYRTKFFLSLAVLAVTILLQAGPALAQGCTTNTYYYQGRMVTCTVCCTMFGCNTTCF